LEDHSKTSRRPRPSGQTKPGKPSDATKPTNAPSPTSVTEPSPSESNITEVPRPTAVTTPSKPQSNGTKEPKPSKFSTRNERLSLIFLLLGRGPKDSSSSEEGESLEDHSKTSRRPQASGETKPGKPSDATKPTNAPKSTGITKPSKPQPNETKGPKSSKFRTPNQNLLLSFFSFR
jgi:hypothetical protein